MESYKAEFIEELFPKLEYSVSVAFIPRGDYKWFIGCVNSKEEVYDELNNRTYTKYEIKTIIILP